MAKEKGNNNDQEKKQSKHPVEICEVVRGDLKLYSPLYRRVTTMPIETKALIENSIRLWDVKAKTYLTQLHSLVFDAFLTNIFVNKTIMTVETPISRLIGQPTLVGVVYYGDLRRLLPSKLSKSGQMALLETLSELRTKITLETVVIDKQSNKKIGQANSGLVDNFILVSIDPEQREEIIKDTFKNNPIKINRIKEIYEEKQKLYDERNWIKPKDSDLLVMQIPPVVPLLFAASKLRLNYSTTFIDKLSQIQDGPILSIVKFITSQKTPFSISAVKLFAKIENIPKDRKKWTIKQKNKYKRFTSKIKIHASRLQDQFNIVYDSEKMLFNYNTPAIGVGFSIPEVSSDPLKLTILVDKN
ncbi:hypothetical protein [Hippea maritima]|uniref:Uncharacterized protein n=1 Tax=Hippea maritima (strain ATCC 700847 / DSM 10411 / MH2) TaxID=760142 RepID=F2LV71_HIPMA|nr:hypothetical protein [Hippea maritima]AEA33655.1 hypothetical protein Hipma_0685 [Hippea maritima DSM 10411]